MDIVIRAAVAFLVILFLTRIVGRRELGRLEPFDLILLVTIGDLVQQGVTQNDFSVTGMFLAIGTIGLLTVLFSYLPWRFRVLRPVLEGVPIILVEEGKVVEKNVKRQRLTQEEIAAAARVHNIASLDEVRWAVLETNGQISFIKKS
ncbi:MAG TPA: YetF domain-containing protein [Gaiellaceae bacterium]